MGTLCIQPNLMLCLSLSILGLLFHDSYCVAQSALQPVGPPQEQGSTLPNDETARTLKRTHDLADERDQVQLEGGVTADLMSGRRSSDVTTGQAALAVLAGNSNDFHGGPRRILRAKRGRRRGRRSARAAKNPTKSNETGAIAATANVALAAGTELALTSPRRDKERVRAWSGAIVADPSGAAEKAPNKTTEGSDALGEAPIDAVPSGTVQSETGTDKEVKSAAGTSEDVTAGGLLGPEGRRGRARELAAGSAAESREASLGEPEATEGGGAEGEGAEPKATEVEPSEALQPIEDETDGAAKVGTTDEGVPVNEGMPEEGVPANEGVTEEGVPRNEGTTGEEGVTGDGVTGEGVPGKEGVTGDEDATGEGVPGESATGEGAEVVPNSESDSILSRAESGVQDVEGSVETEVVGSRGSSENLAGGEREGTAMGRASGSSLETAGEAQVEPEGGIIQSEAASTDDIAGSTMQRTRRSRRSRAQGVEGATGASEELTAGLSEGEGLPSESRLAGGEAERGSEEEASEGELLAEGSTEALGGGKPRAAAAGDEPETREEGAASTAGEETEPAEGEEGGESANGGLEESPKFGKSPALTGGLASPEGDSAIPDDVTGDAASDVASASDVTHAVADTAEETAEASPQIIGDSDEAGGERIAAEKGAEVEEGEEQQEGKPEDVGAGAGVGAGVRGPVMPGHEGVPAERAEPEAYADFMSEVFRIKERFGATMQGMKDKTQKHFAPHLSKMADSGRQAFTSTSASLETKFVPYLGQQYSPVFSTVVSYGLLLVPLALVIIAFERIRAMFSLQKVLLFANLYLALYCFSLLAACLIITGEPMAALQQAAEVNYFVLQLVQAVAFSAYLLVQMVNLILTLREKNSARGPKVIAGIQFSAAWGVGLHYYVMVFQRAMVDERPLMSWRVYATYAAVFGVLCLLARLRPSKEDARRAGDATAKHL